MPHLNLNSVMDGLGVRLATLPSLRVYDFPPDSGSPPFAFVSFPEVVTYDSTMRRGSDQLQIQVHVLVGKVSDRSARDALSGYISGLGANSVKGAIEGDRTLGGSVQSCRVMEAEISTTSYATQDLLMATFLIDIIT